MPRPRRTSERVPPGTYERLVAEHGAETCWICGNTPKTRRLHIDHAGGAKALRIRGLLDARCNRALPSWVTPLWLVQAALYLLRASARDRVLTIQEGQASSALHRAADYLEAWPR